MKKLVLITVMVLSVCILSGCTKKNNGLKFKEDYESLNGKTNANGLEHRKLNIDEDNPYVFVDAEDIIEKINNKETFYVYFGDKQCPWCRSVIEVSIEEAKKAKVDTIYYVAIWDDDHNEILRDTYSVDEEGTLVLEKKGTKTYTELLNAFEDVLRDYELKDKDGNTVEVGEKRIYAPNYFYVKDGKVVKMTSGKSELQTDSREELTDEMIQDEKDSFKEFFNK